MIIGIPKEIKDSGSARVCLLTSSVYLRPLLQGRRYQPLTCFASSGLSLRGLVGVQPVPCFPPGGQALT